MNHASHHDPVNKASLLAQLQKQAEHETHAGHAHLEKELPTPPQESAQG